MISRIRLQGLLAAAVVLAAVAAPRASPVFWQVATQVDFQRGEVEHLSIDSDGRVVLGQLNELLYESTAPFLWTLAAAPDGTLYAGSGNEGRVFRIAPDGTASTFFDADELAVQAITVGADGTVYVGTSPDGRVYRVAPDGTAETFFEPDERYIWALALGADGTLYVGTGDRGTIYRVAPDGTGAPLYRSRTTHVLALAFDREGRLLAGTESPGQVMRIEREGRAFVLLDSGFREIRALRVDPESGVVFAAALSGRPPAEERPAQPAPDPQGVPVPTVSTEITGVAVVDAGSQVQTSGAARDQGRTASGAVFRIRPDGLWDTFWESSEDAPYDLVIEGDDDLIIGTGNNGRVYRVTGDPARVTLLARASAQQVTTFLQEADGQEAGGRRYYATANPGKVFRLSQDRATVGTYTSEVRDAGTVASWGTIRWRASLEGDARVEVRTRSGNTPTPDDTWSDWSAPYASADGDQIVSPNGRYLQWRATLAAQRGTPVLTSVTAAYLQRNLRPRVLSITVHPPGIVFQRAFAAGEIEIAGYEETSPEGRPGAAPVAQGGTQQGGAPMLGRRFYQKGLQTFAWKAEDPNDDRLQFDVLYRRQEDTDWKVLRRDLTDPILTWDTTSVPDGTYTIKIVASDAPSNSPGTALEGELESSAFDIDNTPPRIAVSPARRGGDRLVIPFVVRDNLSVIRRVEYSLDGDRWQVVYPKDGIPDSPVEEFELALEPDESPRSVIIRATDAMNNSATALGVPEDW